MKKVYLIRHAKSSWSNAELSDFDRPLNKRGKRDAPFMAKLFAAKCEHPTRIISSPANRAITTARYFAEALGIDQAAIVQNEDIYEAWTDTIVEIIREQSKEIRCLALFGHNPTFTNVANLFAENYIPNMPTCSIVEITSEARSWKEFDPENAKVTAFHFPKQYFD